MAKAKVSASKKPTQKQLASAALDHVHDLAAGQRRAGFGFTDLDDDLFAAGFPHLCLVFEDVDDPAVVAEKLLLDGYPFLDVAVPRHAATLLVRARASGKSVDHRMGKEPVLGATAKKIIKGKDPLVIDEVREHFDTILRGSEPAIDRILFICEALLGTIPVLEKAVDALEAFPAAEFFDSPAISCQWLDALVLMLDRAPGVRADGLLARLRSWADSSGLSEPDRADAGIGVLEHVPVVEPPRPVVRATAAELVRARKSAAKRPWYTLPDPRLVFLGGEDLYAIELGLWADYHEVYTPAEAHAIILERFGRIRSPTTVELAVDMAARSKVKPQALAWLTAHREYALPHLKKLARAKRPVAAAAAEILARMDG